MKIRRSILFSLMASGLVLPALAALAQPASPFGFDDAAETAMGEQLATRAPRKIEGIGTTSVTLRFDFGVDLDAAYKPRTRSHPRGYLAEIAAYRISRALGMDNVPPAVLRSVPRMTIQERIVTEDPADWEAMRQEILWDLPGVARGAAIYWVPHMRPSELQTMAGLTRAAPWLALGGEAPVGREGVAHDLATMLAFDYLIGNWDRFSGGNVSENEEGTRLIVRDHNVAFLVPISTERYERMRTALETAPRFSRSFVERLQALNDAQLIATLTPDSGPDAQPLLQPAQIEGILVRRRALLSYVSALVAVHGAERVLAWP